MDVPVAVEKSAVATIGWLNYGDPETDEFGSCSASVISTDTKSTLWTAAHCVHRGDGSGDAGFYPYVAFLAGVDEGYTLWDFWDGVEVRASEEYTEETDPGGSADGRHRRPWVDTVSRNDDFGNIVDAVGAFEYSFGSADHPEAYVAGYPVEGWYRDDWGPHQNLWECRGNTEDAGNLNPFDDRLMMDCVMGRGCLGDLGSSSQLKTEHNWSAQRLTEVLSVRLSTHQSTA